MKKLCVFFIIISFIFLTEQVYSESLLKDIKKESTNIKKQPPESLEKKPLPQGIQAQEIFDLQIPPQNVSLMKMSGSMYRIDLAYSTGNPNIKILDKPIEFYVKIKTMVRPTHDDIIRDEELVNKKFTLAPREAFFIVTFDWPHYATDIDVSITINPDKKISETNYGNNTYSNFFWESSGQNCFRLLAWPYNSAPDNVFNFLLMYSNIMDNRPQVVVKNYGTLDLYEFQVKELIKRGIVTYMPGGQHGEQDFLIIPVRVAVGKCSKTPNSISYTAKTIFYDGPRTYEGNINCTMGVGVVTLNLGYKIQKENFLEFKLGNGMSYKVYIKFHDLPWKL